MEIVGGRVQEPARHDVAGERGRCVDAAEAVESGAHESFGDLRVGHVPDMFGDGHRGAECLKFVDEAWLGVTDDEIVALRAISRARGAPM